MGKATKATKATGKQKLEANQAVFEDFFQDYHRHRRQIYFMNFVRGIWFGLGSVIGGTFVLAMVAWALSLFEQVPFLTDIVVNVQSTIDQARK